MGILNINYGFFEFWVVEEQVTEVESGKHCNGFLAHCISTNGIWIENLANDQG